MKKNIIIALLSIVLAVVFYKYFNEGSVISDREFLEFGSRQDSPKSLQMYYHIERYADVYDVPLYVAYNIAYIETKYKGPYDWEYDPCKSSPSGALGPMQIMISTCNKINKESVSRSKLKNDIEYNIETSMKLLHRLYEKYHDWEKVCGSYNTGKPIVNSYARFCANNKNYKSNWIKI